MKGIILSLDKHRVVLQAHPLLRRYFGQKRLIGVQIDRILENETHLSVLMEVIVKCEQHPGVMHTQPFPISWIRQEFKDLEIVENMTLFASTTDMGEDSITLLAVSPIDTVEKYYSLLRSKDELFARSIHVLKDMSLMLINEPSSKVAARKSVEMVRRLFNAQSVIIRLVKHGRLLEKYVSDGVPGEYLADHLEYEIGDVPVYQEALQTKQTIICEDIKAGFGQMYEDFWKFNHSKLVVVQPILSGKEVTGIFALNFDHQNQLMRESLDILENVVNEFNFILERGNNFMELLNTTEKMKSLNIAIVSTLSSAIETRDPYTKGHSERVATYAVEIARNMGWDDYELDRLRTAGLLHDVGKVGIPDGVLLKPNALNKNEFEIMKLHPEISAAIVSGIDSFGDLVPWVRYHHENLDGTGYPYGLKGNEIPLGSRVISVADAFDAMTSTRPYRKAMSLDRVFDIMRTGAGIQWDGDIIEVALNCLEVIEQKEGTEYHIPELLNDFRKRIFNTNLMDGLYLYTFLYDQMHKYIQEDSGFTLGVISLYEYLGEHPSNERKEALDVLIEIVKKHAHFPVQVGRYSYYQILLLAPKLDKSFMRKLLNRILMEFFQKSNLYFTSDALSYPNDSDSVDQMVSDILSRVDGKKDHQKESA